MSLVSHSQNTQSIVENNRPDSISFWGHYPNYSLGPKAVWYRVNGSLFLEYLRQCKLPKNERTYSDSCALRVSIALHYVQPIPSGIDGANRNLDTKRKEEDGILKDDDGFIYNQIKFEAKIKGRFILSARKMRKYLESTWGQGDIINDRNELAKYKATLQEEQIAVCAQTRHTGVIKKGYVDVNAEGIFPTMAWKLK